MDTPVLKRTYQAGTLAGAVAVIAVGILTRAGVEVTAVEGGALAVIFAHVGGFIKARLDAR